MKYAIKFAFGYETFCVHLFYELRLWQKGRHFTDDISKSIFLLQNCLFLVIISLEFVPNGTIYNQAFA